MLIGIPLVALLWAIALSGFGNGPFFWRGVATGTVACLIAVAVTWAYCSTWLELRRPSRY
jgi:hypothetical protein